MKQLLLSATLLGALGLLAGGCQSPAPSALSRPHKTRFDVELKEKFEVLDPNVQRSVTCMGLKETILADGRLEVDTLVRNWEKKRLQVQIQCEFKDLHGALMDPPSWETLVLPESSTETKSFVSLTAKARRYTVRVRQAR